MAICIFKTSLQFAQNKQFHHFFITIFITILFFNIVVLMINHVFVMQWSNDMIGYVYKQGLNVLCGVAASLLDIYLKDGTWQQINGKHRCFKTLLVDV